MKKNIEDRILHEANRIIESDKTLREISKEFNISKSTIHKDMQQKLININPYLYEKVNEVFQRHLENRYYFNK